MFRHRPSSWGGRRSTAAAKDLAWFRPDGRELIDNDWFSPDVETLGMYLDGDGLRSRSRRGERIDDDTFLLLVHAGTDDTTFTLPGEPWATSWCVLLDTTTDQPATDERPVATGQGLALTARSALLLRAG